MKKILLPLAMVSLFTHTMNAQKNAYPKTKSEKVEDTYFGNKVADPYRWLENDTAKETTAWVKQQNKYTNDYLSKIPFRDAIKKRLSEVWNYPKIGAPQQHGAYFLVYKNNGLQNQAVLYIKKGLNGPEKILLDPNTLSKDGTVAIQATAFSKNQRYFAYAVSASGSDWQEIYIIDISTGKLLSEKIENVKFTSISWLGDEGFYYSGYSKPKDAATKYSAKTEYQKVFFHAANTDQASDKLVYEDTQHPLRYVFPQVTEDEQYLVLNMSEGTSGSEIDVIKIADKSQKRIQLVKGFDTDANVISTTKDGRILLYTNRAASNYQLVSVDPNKPQPENWKTIIKETENYLEGVTTGGGKLFATYLKNACSHVEQLSIDGTLEQTIALPGLGTASGFGAYESDKGFYYTYTSFTQPATVYHYDIKTKASSLYQESAVKFKYDDYETKQIFFPSKDGTMVPMFVTYKKGIKLDGTNPTLLYGYGGFNISLTPSFSIANVPFLEQGGIYVLVNLRGGGEFGDSWHKSGMLGQKQTVFDDFIGAAEYLIAEKYTSSKKLAIRGGSNGGLLVGACMVQRPELFAVAIPQVGVLDMLRYHKFTVGWGWAVEYGTSDKSEDFNYLIKYSPLHNVKKGTCYPATMVTTADHDDRVVPAHSFKFAATLQEAQGCDKPTLIRIDEKAGHGAGKPTAKQIDEAADIWSFVLYNMGYKTLKK